MKSEELMRAVAICAHIRRPLYVAGDPGGGKTFSIRQGLKSIGYKPRDVRLGLLEPGDFSMPKINGDEATYVRPHWYPRPDETKVAIVFDEWAQGHPSVQNAATCIIYDRELHGRPLPVDTAIIAAGNLKSNRAATFDMPSHVANRFIHTTYESDIQNFVRYANNPHFIPEPPPLVPHDPNAPFAEEVVGLLRYKPDLLNGFAAKDTGDGKKRDTWNSDELARPTARTWHFVSDLLPQVRNDRPMLRELVAGCVGDGPMAELVSYIDLRAKMTNPMIVFRDPDNAPIPDDLSIRYALMVALSRRVHEIKGAADALFRFLGRLPAVDAADLAVYCVKDAMAINRDIIKCKEGMKWSVANAGVML